MNVINNYLDKQIKFRQIKWLRVNELCLNGTFYCKHHIDTNIGKLLLRSKDIAILQKKIYGIIDEHFIDV